MWTSATGARGTTINRVRLRGVADLDPLSAELRAARAIEHAAGDVPLPAEAILCVWHLRDPHPRHLRLSTLQAPPAEWARAIRQSLSDLARRAARPADGSVAADVEAVIFEDRAQMLACLAADWCRGSMVACWWWRALIGTRAEADAVLRTWLQHAPHVTAALEEVTRLGYVIPLLWRWSNRETMMLLEAVVVAHGLDARLASSSPPKLPAVPPDGSRPRTASPNATAVRQPNLTRAITPWRDAAPEACVPALDSDQQQLLGIALTVRRDPARARDQAFAVEVARWRAEIASSNTTGAITTHPRLPAPIAKSVQSEVTRRSVDDATPMTAHPRGLDSRSAAPLPAAGGESLPITPPHLPASSARTDEPVGKQRVRHPGTLAAGAQMETELGGIFYLLDVALALGLYGDFTAPRGPRLDLSIWRFIALVGGALLRGRHRRDGVWSLLARLAGPDPPSLRGIADWRLDASWLAAFPEQRTWRWSADKDRLRVRHPDGFLVLDVTRARERTATQQLSDETAPYRSTCSFRLVGGPDTRDRPNTELARWIRWHTSYTRARLARALGVPRSRAGQMLCRHHARVRLSLTHVDVTFSLNELPVAIRMSGLDRDPGWIPAADRIVSFRYE